MSKEKLSKSDKSHYVKIARDLRYSKDVEDQLWKAKSEYEACRIMSDAHNNVTFNRHKK